MQANDEDTEGTKAEPEGIEGNAYAPLAHGRLLCGLHADFRVLCVKRYARYCVQCRFSTLVAGTELRSSLIPFFPHSLTP